MEATLCYLSKNWKLLKQPTFLTLTYVKGTYYVTTVVWWNLFSRVRDFKVLEGMGGFPRRGIETRSPGVVVSAVSFRSGGLVLRVQVKS